MDFLSNVSDLNYDNWKRSINQFLLYKHFKDKAVEENNSIIVKMKKYEEIKDKTEQQKKEYMELLNQLVFNSSSLYQQVEKNLNNNDLLNQLYEEKNIDVSEAAYKRWIQTGDKIKI